MGKPAMVINMESGGFNKLVINKYDYKLDMESEKPYEQRLEKWFLVVIWVNYYLIA